MTDTTLVAAYRNIADAQAAATDLETAGIKRSDIYIENSSASTAAGNSAYGSRTKEHQGGVAGWFKSLFGDNEPEQDIRGYHDTLQQGGYLLSVDVDNSHLDSVETILNRHNPINVTSDDQTTYRNDATATSGMANAAATGRTANPASGLANTGDVVPVIQEDLQVGKRSVLRGGVRVISRLVETPVEESIGLREEHVHVNRQAVNRPATEADFAAGRNQAIELEEYAEEAVVGKQARVVEEINVGKEVNERAETVRDTVRHTEVEVEDLTADKTRSKTTGR